MDFLKAWSFIDACSGTWVCSNCFLISCNSASTELYCCSILSTHSISHSGEGEGLLFYGNVILPFVDRFPKDTELYRIMTTKPSIPNCFNCLPSSLMS